MKWTYIYPEKIGWIISLKLDIASTKLSLVLLALKHQLQETSSKIANVEEIFRQTFVFEKKTFKLGSVNNLV